MNDTTMITVIRQTQYDENIINYVYEAYKSRKEAQKECNRLNEEYFREDEHFYTIDNIELI